MDIGFERIHPTPSYPPGLSSANFIAVDWSSRAGHVLNFKTTLKTQLRHTQLGRCCYCRRLLADPMATDLEHFIEKAIYPSFTFEILNLALSCGTCNNKKNAKFMRLNRYLSRRAKVGAGTTVAIRRCPTLATHPLTLAAVPNNSAAYRWVHPHLDDYSDHLAIEKGWVFTWRSAKGFRTVRGLELNALAQLERRAIAERLASRTGHLSLLVGALAELNQATAKDVGALVAEELRRRRLARRTNLLT